MEKEKDRKIRSAFGTATTIIMVLFAVYCVMGVVSQNKTGKLFYVFQHKPVIILSGSMEPYLKDGAVVIVRKTKNIKEQDIVFFETEPEAYVIHRCVGKDEKGKYVTKGDRNPKEDFEHVSSAQIEGKVVLRMNIFAPVIKKCRQHFLYFIA